MRAINQQIYRLTNKIISIFLQDSRQISRIKVCKVWVGIFLHTFLEFFRNCRLKKFQFCRNFQESGVLVPLLPYIEVDETRVGYFFHEKELY